MSQDRDLAITSPPTKQDLATAPPRPQIEPGEMYTGGPFVLEMHGRETSWKHSLGWMERSQRRGGTCFLIIRSTFTGSFRTVERFPLTDAGWTRAWKTLVRLDRDGAAMVLEVLAARARAAAAKAALAELTAQSLCALTDVRYIPGSGELPDIGSGSRLDVRFLADRVVLVPAASPRILAGFSYLDVAAVDIGGPGRIQRWTPGQQAALGLAFGLPAGIMAAAATRIKTVVRFEAAGCELFVVDDKTEPDVLRIQLSPGLWAIREAREADGRPGPDDGESTEASEAASVVDRLAKLASLLEAGLITRAEFDRLKAALLAGTDDGQDPEPDASPPAVEGKRFTAAIGRSAWPGVPSVAPFPPVPPIADPPFTPGWPGPGAG
jgi:hypothetical protein